MWYRLIWFDFWCFNATFSNISAISWRPVLVVEEAGVPGENHRPWTSNWKTLSLAAASRVHLFVLFTKPDANPRRIGDRLVWAVRSNDLTHWATRAPRDTEVIILILLKRSDGTNHYLNIRYYTRPSYDITREQE